jgi:hypothetical protein
VAFNSRTNQFTLTFTVDQELHDYLKQSLPSNKLSEFIRYCLNKEINQQKELESVDNQTETEL